MEWTILSIRLCLNNLLSFTWNKTVTLQVLCDQVSLITFTMIYLLYMSFQECEQFYLVLGPKLEHSLRKIGLCLILKISLLFGRYQICFHYRVVYAGIIQVWKIGQTLRSTALKLTYNASINLALSTAANDLKHALVMPILKKGGRTDAYNFRLISITTT